MSDGGTIINKGMSPSPRPRRPRSPVAEPVQHPRHRALLEPLVRQGWVPAAEPHPLATLHTQRVAGCTPLVLLGPENRVGARYFQVYLVRRGGLEGGGPALSGLHHQGRYPQHSWVEVMTTQAPESAQEEELFGALTRLLLPGGHLMVEYEGPGRRETERALSAGVPPLLTPLGAAMFRSGCGYGFRDWYISEGGNEGPRKLQGYKPLDEGHRRSTSAALARQALEYLQSTSHRGSEPLTATARRLARELLPQLPLDGDPRLAAEVRAWLAQP